MNKSDDKRRISAGYSIAEAFCREWRGHDIGSCYASQLGTAIDDAIHAEREACAKLAIAHSIQGLKSEREMAKTIAAAIQSRGDTEAT